MDALSRLTGDAQTFIDKVWARQIHVHTGAPADVAGLLELANVDHLLTATALRVPALRLAQDGSVLASSRYTRAARLGGVQLTGLVDPRKVLDLFDGGASIVLQGLHRYWPPLTRLARDLELALGHPCQANAYLTPPGSQGFALHADTHDVFVVQTYGTKEWEVHDGAGIATRVRMESGVSMYLPTGTPHAARTEQSASLHITIGINRVTWREVLDRHVRRLLADPTLEEPLPAAYHRDEERFAALLAERLDHLRALLSRAEPATLANHELDRFATTRPPMIGGALVDRLQLADLGDATLMRRRAGSVCELRRDGDRLRVLLGDRELRVPGWLAEPLERIRSVHRFTPNDLAEWLDEPSRLVLVRRLVREGLLEVDS